MNDVPSANKKIAVAKKEVEKPVGTGPKKEVEIEPTLKGCKLFFVIHYFWLIICWQSIALCIDSGDNTDFSR